MYLIIENEFKFKCNLSNHLIKINLTLNFILILNALIYPGPLIKKYLCVGRRGALE